MEGVKMNKFLKGVYREVGELKKAYKEWAFKLHPDVSGLSGEEMKVLNAEYESLITKIPKKASNEKKAENPNYEFKGFDYYFDPEFIQYIDDLIKLHMKEVQCEIAGFFIYLSGETKPYKDDLKKLGYLWNTAKSLWYKKPDWYRKQSKEIWTMDKIRENFNTRRVDIDDGIAQIR